MLLGGVIGINELLSVRGGLNRPVCSLSPLWASPPRHLRQSRGRARLRCVSLPFLPQLFPAPPLPLPAYSSFSSTILAFHLISKLGKGYKRVTFVTIMKIYLEFIFVQIK